MKSLMTDKKIMSVSLVFLFAIMFSFPHVLAILDSPVNVSNSVDAISDSQQIAVSDSDVHVVWREGTGINYANNNTDFTTIQLSASGTIPQIELSGSDVHVVWREGTNIKYNNNTNNFGLTPIQLNSLSSNFPQLAVSGSDVHVVWREGTNIKYNNNTNNFGATPVTLSLTSSAASPQITASDSVAHIVWRNISTINYTNTNNLSLPPTTLTTTGTNPQITSFGSDVHVVWQDTVVNAIQYNNNTNNFGLTPITLTPATITPTPQIAVSGSGVHIVWVGGIDSDVYYASSLNGFTPINLSNTIGLSSDPQIAASGNDVSIIWKDDTNGGEIYSRSSSDGGITFDEVGLLSNSTNVATVPKISVSGSTIVNSWLEDISGFTDVFVRSGATDSVVIDNVDVDFDSENYDYGDIAGITVKDDSANLNENTIDSVTVHVNTIQDPTGFDLILDESDVNSGIFNNAQLAFMTGDQVYPMDYAVNYQVSAPGYAGNGTVTINMNSATTPSGINLLLAETGASTGIFEHMITLSSTTTDAASATIQVSAGDFLKFSGPDQFFTSGMIIPNPSGSHGIILAKVLDGDTVTVSYGSYNDTAQILDLAASGGGAGGISRAGFVVQAVGSVFSAGGGGTDSSAPTLSLNNLIHSGLDFPPEIEQMILNHNSLEPISPMKLDAFENFDFPLIINNQGFVLGGFSNTIQTQNIPVNTPVQIKLLFYETTKIQHLSLYTNLRDDKTQIHQSDTQILYNDGKPIKIVDPNGLFADATVTINDIDDVKKQAVFDITFAKPMDTSDIIIRSWDPTLHSTDTFILDALNVSSETVESPVKTYEEPQIEQLVSQSIPIWVKNNAGWWSDNQISDEDFVAGIQYMVDNGIISISSKTVNSSVTDIPDWIQNNAGWWSENKITDDDFVEAMKWLITNGVIIVQ